MTKGRSLEGATGWWAIERRQRRSWRAGYVILPTAVVVGALQILIPSHRDSLGSSSDDRQRVATSGGPSSAAERGEGKLRPLPDLGPSVRAGSASASDEATPSLRPVRVVIHHTAGAHNALPAIQLAAFLQTRGFAVADIRPVDVLIERPRVRYFFASDQPASRRLVEAIGAFLEGRGPAPDQAADLSHLSTKQRQGNVEVWLPPSGVASISQST